ncbi:hypothetical protein NP493_175g03002 [Ridgeia piscesae]|uniref:Uncharacterized protein n=1 Tax=Ridgeia piscesae TaxID=27915 RepID=A0AAD9UF69_RIDPI|nr:hypothetical protein NP493_175g03002 [Ridgeia piscesae]
MEHFTSLAKSLVLATLQLSVNKKMNNTTYSLYAAFFFSLLMSNSWSNTVRKRGRPRLWFKGSRET